MNWATERECEVSGLDPEIVEAQSEGSAPVLEVRKSLLEVRLMLKLMGIEDGALARGGLTRLPILGEDDSMCRSQMQRRRHGWGIRGC